MPLRDERFQHRPSDRATELDSQFTEQQRATIDPGIQWEGKAMIRMIRGTGSDWEAWRIIGVITIALAAVLVLASPGAGTELGARGFGSYLYGLGGEILRG